MIGNVNVPGASAADLANKVDKVTGKGLSTNDFTDAYKMKLDNMVSSNSPYEYISLSDYFQMTPISDKIYYVYNDNGAHCIYKNNIRCENNITLDILSWREINILNNLDVVSEFINIGDEKTIILSTDENITLQVYDFKHDDIADGGKAGITFGLKDLMQSIRQMNSTNTNVGGFIGSDMYEWLQGDLYNSLPADLKPIIKLVNKNTSAGNKSSALNISSMKIFLFSQIEVNGVYTYASMYEGFQYPIFQSQTQNNRSKHLPNSSSNIRWWQRSPHISSNDNFCCTESSGGPQAYSASNQYGVNFGFCI